jgi:hypothetical protein
MIQGRYCPECGEPIVRMDGHTDRYWRRLEEEFNNKCEEKELEREESEDEEDS